MMKTGVQQGSNRATRFCNSQILPYILFSIRILHTSICSCDTKRNNLVSQYRNKICPSIYDPMKNRALSLIDIVISPDYNGFEQNCEICPTGS